MFKFKSIITIINGLLKSKRSKDSKKAEGIEPKANSTIPKSISANTTKQRYF